MDEKKTYFDLAKKAASNLIALGGKKKNWGLQNFLSVLDSMGIKTKDEIEKIKKYNNLTDSDSVKDFVDLSRFSGEGGGEGKAGDPGPEAEADVVAAAGSQAEKKIKAAEKIKGAVQSMKTRQELGKARKQKMQKDLHISSIFEQAVYHWRRSFYAKKEKN